MNLLISSSALGTKQSLNCSQVIIKGTTVQVFDFACSVIQ